MTVMEAIDVDKRVFVSDDDTLTALCERWNKGDFIALDTEFVRTDTFYPKIGLIQIGDESGCYLIDPFGISDWSAFISLLQNRDLCCVVHSCSEDLALLKGFLGTVPAQIFDTQRAAAFLGLGYSISYQGLVKAVFDQDVPKDATRSDWLQRPLTEQQQHYAALDVAWLPALYHHLKDKLEAKGYLSWLREDCAHLSVPGIDEEDNSNWESYYRNIKGAWGLDETALALLQSLGYWREKTAREENRPRSWIARDNDLLAIVEECRNRETTAIELRNIRGLPRNFERRYGKALVEVLTSPNTFAERPDPDSLQAPLPRALRRAMKHCQQAVKEKAESLEIAPELLARRKQLVELLQIHAAASIDPGSDIDTLPWPPELQGWRQAQLKPVISRVLEAEADQTPEENHDE